jgi:hypothetical protein
MELIDPRLQEWLIEKSIECRHDPLKWVMLSFPWGETGGELDGISGPEPWQIDVLNMIRDGVATLDDAIRIAVASGHGVGKTALVSWIILWALTTCLDTRGVVTANTGDQLRGKTWAELGKWHRLCAWRDWFRYRAESIYSVDPRHERTWRIDMVTWSENNTEAFAGLHNKNRRILVIFDEASAIPDAIWEVTEGALTDANTEILWFCPGNPTRNTGRFRECFGRFKHRWKTMQVDGRRVSITNKQLFSQWIQDYGEDSDFVRVRIKGEFPRAGTMQFIPGDIVEIARHRQPEAYLGDPCVMGVDVARFGDDQSVIVVRRGRDAKSVPWVKLRGVDTMTLAATIVDLANRHKPDTIFVDGGGVGGGVIDRLRMLRQHVTEVQFGARADRAIETGDGAIVYANKRAEMWGSMRDWIKGGAIPDDPDLAGELTSVEYGYAIRDGRDAILLERKEDMRRRGLASPDLADALCLTFAYPVVPSDHSADFGGRNAHQAEYDPFASMNRHRRDYDPFARMRDDYKPFG